MLPRETDSWDSDEQGKRMISHPRDRSYLHEITLKYLVCEYYDFIAVILVSYIIITIWDSKDIKTI